MATQEQLDALRTLFDDFSIQITATIDRGEEWKEDAWKENLSRLAIKAAEVIEEPNGELPKIDRELLATYKLQEAEIEKINATLTETQPFEMHIAYKKLKQTALGTLAKTARSLADFRAAFCIR